MSKACRSRSGLVLALPDLMRLALGAVRSSRDPFMELADCLPPPKTKMCAGGALTFYGPTLNGTGASVLAIL